MHCSLWLHSVSLGLFLVDSMCFFSPILLAGLDLGAQEGCLVVSEPHAGLPSYGSPQEMQWKNAVVVEGDLQCCCTECSLGSNCGYHYICAQ